MAQISTERAMNFIQQWEGKSATVYTDTQGHPTVGIGFNMDREDAREIFTGLGINYDQVKAGELALSNEQINSLFQKDVDTAISDAHALVTNLDNLPENAQEVVIDMAFNLGYSKFSGFENAIEAFNNGDLKEAAAEMQDSKWYEQVGDRAIQHVETIHELGETNENNEKGFLPETTPDSGTINGQESVESIHGSDGKDDLQSTQLLETDQPTSYLNANSDTNNEYLLGEDSLPAPAEELEPALTESTSPTEDTNNSEPFENLSPITEQSSPYQEQLQGTDPLENDEPAGNIEVNEPNTFSEVSLSSIPESEPTLPIWEQAEQGGNLFENSTEAETNSFAQFEPVANADEQISVASQDLFSQSNQFDFTNEASSESSDTIQTTENTTFVEPSVEVVSEANDQADAYASWQANEIAGNEVSQFDASAVETSSVETAPDSASENTTDLSVISGQSSESPSFGIDDTPSQLTETLSQQNELSNLQMEDVNINSSIDEPASANIISGEMQTVFADSDNDTNQVFDTSSISLDSFDEPTNEQISLPDNGDSSIIATEMETVFNTQDLPNSYNFEMDSIDVEHPDISASPQLDSADFSTHADHNFSDVTTDTTSISVDSINSGSPSSNSIDSIE